jgi:DNA-binding transcriptional ArsR family regulator
VPTKLGVTDLARLQCLSLNTVSKHVPVLEHARLVRRRVVGREHFIRVEPKRLGEVEEWLVYHRAFWTVQLDALATFFEAKAHQQKGADDSDNIRNVFAAV